VIPEFNTFVKPTKILILISLAFSTELVAQHALTQASDIDWVSHENLSPEQRALLQDNCCGMYVPPELPELEGEPGAANLTADSLDASAVNRVNLEGDITIRQEDIYMRADTATFDNDTGNAELDGNIQVRKTGMLLVGTDAQVQNAGEHTSINNASYVLHEDNIRGTAEVITYTDTEGIITIDNGAFTRCEPGNNSWVIDGESITLNQTTGRGVARNVKLRIGNTPVLYLPVITFPINDERATGFLAPTFGSTRDGGLDVSTPYYLNLAPNYDVTLTPRVMTDRGVMLGMEGRYRSRLSMNILQVNYLPGDNLYDAVELLLPDPESPPVDDRWQINIDHTSRFTRNWRGLIDYAGVSDEDYFQDLGNTGLYTTTQSYLSRTGGVEYRNNDWLFRIQALSYQIIDPTIPESREPYKRLPRINLNGSFSNDLGFDYGVRTEYVNFDRDLNPLNLSAGQLASGAMVTGQRLTIEPEVSYPWSSPGAFVTPQVKYKYASYDLEDPTNVYTDDPSRGVFVGSIDSGLIFERDVEFANTPLIQTLEPRLYYLYNEYEDQSDIPVFDSSNMTFSFNQLFREDRFSGKDRVGDTNQLTLALSTRFLDERGREKASASIGQIRYFEDRRVTLYNGSGKSEGVGGSAVASEMTWQFSDNWQMNSYLEWSPRESNLEVGNFQFRYQSDINHLLNFSYRYRDVSGNPITAAGFDRRIRQTDISGIWPVSQNWSLIGRWNYDHANDRNLETIAGLEYNNCCYSVRVVARQWIDNDALFHGNVDDNSGVFLQFELKGFGSVLGGNVSGILNNGISGYREREYVR
jgi:LPS-assembly protein